MVAYRSPSGGGGVSSGGGAGGVGGTNGSNSTTLGLPNDTLLYVGIGVVAVGILLYLMHR